MRPNRARHPRGTQAVALGTKVELAGPANGMPWGGPIVGPHPHVQCEAERHAGLSQKGPLAFAQTSVFAHDWPWRPMVNPAISNPISGDLKRCRGRGSPISTVRWGQVVQFV